MFNTFFKFIAPDECAVCDAQDTLLCGRCAAATLVYVPSRCFHCLRPTTDFKQCDVCTPKYDVDSVWVCGVYMAQLKKLIHEYKFLHKRGGAKDLVRIMDTILPPIHPDTIVVNVPTASSRTRQRGFDHAALLAKAFAHKRGLLYLPCLVRTNQTRQLGLHRAERLQNSNGSVRIKSNFRVVGARFLIVDDVVTTGASINEVAKVLKQSGARCANAATIAQVVI